MQREEDPSRRDGLKKREGISIPSRTHPMHDREICAEGIRIRAPPCRSDQRAAGAWHSILAAMGWYLHAIVPEEELEATIERYNHYIVGAILAIVLLVVAWVVVKRKRK